MSDYRNTSVDRVSGDGGAVQVAITAANTYGQGNSGTSLPCRVCYVSALPGNTVGYITVCINSSSISCGAILATNPVVSVLAGPLEIPIDDVSKLWFFSSAGTAQKINIMYRR